MLRGAGAVVGGFFEGDEFAEGTMPMVGRFGLLRDYVEDELQVAGGILGEVAGAGGERLAFAEDSFGHFQRGGRGCCSRG